MSAHSEIVRDYIELRNFLAQSHPQANMKFEIHFKIQSGSLLAFSSISKASVELAKIQPGFYRLFIPHYEVRFEYYALSLVRYINKHFKMPANTLEAPGTILSLSYKHRKNLDLKNSYEP